jgi:lipopolysaccharide transport system ATP-binding protein
MSIEMLDSTGGRTEAVYVGQVLMLRITVRACEYCERLILGIGIKDRLGQLMYGTNTDLSGQPIHRLASGSVVCFEVVFPVLLGIGTYSIHTALSSSGTSFVDNYDWREKVSLFRVLSLGKPSFVGSISLDASIKSYLLEDSG